MKSLCITGAPSASCEAVAQVLYGAGLVPARPLQHGSLVDMRTWHQRAIPLLTSGRSLGRLWDRAAEELLLANLADGAWGWHEAESIWALDYWADLDPGIHFLLLCEPPEQTLAAALLEDEEALDVNDVLERWRARHGRMLEFYLDYPERCLLVDAVRALSSAGALVEGINERWQLLPASCRLTDIATDEAPEAAVQELAQAVVRAWCQPQLASVDTLRQELEAAQLPLSGNITEPNEQSAPERLVHPLRLFQQLLNEQTPIEVERQARAEREAEVLRLTSDLKERTAEIDSLIAEKSRLTKQLSSAQQDLETQRQEADHLTRKLGEALRDAAGRAAAEDNYRVLEQECERLLMSLHEAQDKLEQSLAQRQADLAAFEAERQELATALTAAKHQASSLAEAETQRQALKHQFEQVRIKLNATQQQLAQARAQREEESSAIARERQELQARLEHAHRQANQQVESLRKQQKLAEGEAKRLRQECESLLLTLNRAQEELEGTAERCQQQEKALTALTERLYALKRRAGPLFAADWSATSRPHAQRIDWQFKGLLLGDIEYETLNVALERSGKQATLSIEMPEDAGWSLNTGRDPSFSSLLPSQRDLTIALLPLLQAQLARQEISHKDNREWQRAFAALRENLSKLPPDLVFKAAELRHAQINPDYEHLWISLRQARFADFGPSDWHFRISSARVTPQVFGQEPKLEFPQQDPQLLKNWFEESRDDFGAKLELRYALPNAVDLAIWARLPRQDQLLIESLIRQLPDIIGRLEQQQVVLNRPADDWIRLAENMRRILQAQAT